MELIYTDQAMQKQGVLRDFALDMAFGDSENDFQLTMPTPQSKRMGIDRDAIIETCSGTGSIEIQDANGSILQGLSVDGKSEQVRYSGKNLFATGSTDSEYGVTYTVNDDGSITLNGTATFTRQRNIELPMVLPAGTYTLSYRTDKAAPSGVYVRVRNSSNSIPDGLSLTVNQAVSSSKTVAISSNIRYACITVDNGTTVNNLTIRIQLEKSATATDFEPYVGGIPSPNPDYPQPVQVVEGRNLLKPSIVETTHRGVTFTPNNDGTVTINGSTGSSTAYVEYASKVHIKPGMVLSGTGNDSLRIQIWDDTSNKEVAIGRNDIVTTSEVKNASIWIHVIANVTVIGVVIKPQLERGSVATPFVPYDALDVTIRGKNLLDMSAANFTNSGFTSSNGVKNGAQNFTRITQMKEMKLRAGTYTLSYKILNSSWVLVYDMDGIYRGNGYVQSAWKDGTSNTFTILEDSLVSVSLRYSTNANVDINGNYEIQIEQGNQATPYDPYTETRTTLDLQGHKGVSLPDGAKDKLTVDANGRIKLVKRAGVVDLSSLSWNWGWNAAWYTDQLIDAKSAPANGDVFNAIADSYSWTPYPNHGDIGFSCWYSYASVPSRLAVCTGSSTVKPTGMLYYELATPQTYDLGTIELPQMLNGYTRITLDATIDAPFSVEYEAAPASKSYTVEVIPHLQSGALVYSFGTDIGGIVDSEVFDSTGDIPVMAYSGRTWHGILDASITRPDSGQGYLTLTGDINAAIGTLISRAGLGSVFEAGQDAGVSVSYQVPRYISVWEALRRLCKAYGMRPSIHRDNGKTIVEAVQKHDYSNGSVSELSMPLSFGRDYRPVNHLVVLGQGELADRTVIDLYADASGNISTRQTLMGAYEVAEVYENTNEADAAKLREDGIKKLQELQRFASVDMALPQNEQFQIGDTVTAYSTEVGLMAAAEVVKKVVTVGEDGFAITDYELGEPAIKAYR